jgi:hypothetical protein
MKRIIFSLSLAFLNFTALDACEQRDILPPYITSRPVSHCSFCSTEKLQVTVRDLREDVSSIHQSLESQQHSSREIIKRQRDLCEAVAAIPAALSPSLEASLGDLVNSRLHNDMMINSVSVVFAGKGVLFDYDKTLALRGGARIISLFSPSELSAEVYRTTLSEKLGMFLDTVFGLKSDREGLPPPYERNGSLVSLLTCKFDFVLGPQRNGLGEDYGYSNTSDHFSDNLDSKITVPGFKNGAGIVVDPTLPLQKVSDFFDSYGVETDYGRLKILFDVLTIIRR